MTNNPILPPPPDDLAARAAAALACAPAALTLTAIAGDAGSRRYYRVRSAQGTHMAVTDEDAAQQRTFLHMRELFAAAAVRVPQVQAEGAGFLLLEDFGDTTYLRHLPADADALVGAAITTLVQFQRDATLAQALPPYDAKRLNDEMQLFADWYCPVHLSRPLSDAAQRTLHAAQEFLTAAMTGSAPVAVHRDYHSRNLMLLALGQPPGVLDFQDAVRGDALYDVVSLLRDAYVEWQAEKQAQWLEAYWRTAHRAGIDAGGALDECRERFNIAGAQRGLKVLGIFARLNHRDGKPQYLADLPRVHRHLAAACAAVPALAPLARLVADHPPK